MPIRKSRVFYTTRDQTAGSTLIRIIVTEGKIVAYSKILTSLKPSGGWVEATTSVQTYSLKTNTHGQKYIELKTRECGTGKGLEDNSLELLSNSSFCKYRLPDDALQFIEETILEWFGYQYGGQETMPAIKGQLLFPVRQDEACLDMPNFSKGLFRIHERHRSVDKALRRNGSWESFVLDVCRHTVKTSADIAILNCNPNDFLPVASMNLGKALSEFTNNELHSLAQASDLFEPYDLNLISFALDYLPQWKKLQMTDDIIALSEFFETNKKKRKVVRYVVSKNTEIKMKYHFSSDSIPSRERAAVALELAEALEIRRKSWIGNEVMAVRISNSRAVRIPNKMSSVMENWHVLNFLECGLETNLTCEDVEGHFKHLFASSLANDEHLSFRTVKDKRFCVLKPIEFVSPDLPLRNSLFAVLANLVSKSLITSRKTRVFNTTLSQHGYRENEGDYIKVEGSLLSLEDIMTVIDVGAKIVDKRLRKLGQKVTPENRFAYLQLGKLRDDKQSWAYWNMGVKSRNRLRVLRFAKIYDKELIQALETLPDDMFYEIVKLESGMELTKESEDWVR